MSNTDFSNCFICNVNPGNTNFMNVSKYSARSFAELIEMMTGIAIDILSTSICLECEQKVELFDKYYVKANNVKDEICSMLSITEHNFEFIKLETEDNSSKELMTEPNRKTSKKENCFELPGLQQSNDETRNLKTKYLSATPEKITQDQENDKNRDSSFTSKVLEYANKVLNKMEIIEITKADLKVSYNESNKSYLVEVKCPLCFKILSANMWRDHVLISNFERHLLNTHVNMGARRKEEDSLGSILGHSSDDDQMIRTEASVESPLLEKSPSQDKLNEDFFDPTLIEWIINTANQIMARTNNEGKIDKSHLEASYNSATDRYSVKVQCLVCSLMISIKMNNKSTSMTNYKLHLKHFHYKRNSNLKRKSSESPISFRPSMKSSIPQDTSSGDPPHQSLISEIVKISNFVLKSTNVEARISQTDVSVSGEADNYSTKVKCPLCSSMIPTNISKGSISMTNYKRHLRKFHFEKDIKKDSTEDSSIKMNSALSNISSELYDDDLPDSSLIRTVIKRTNFKEKIEEPARGTSKEKSSSRNLSALISKVINIVNSIYESVNSDIRINEKDMIASYDETTDHYSVKVKCLVCSKMIVGNMIQNRTSMSNYKRHIMSNHVKEPNENLAVDDAMKSFRCLTCSKGFSSEIYLKRHESIHKERTVFMCDLCGATLASKRSFVRHCSSRHTDTQMYPCPNCSKVCRTINYLKSHLRSHTNACEVYKCPDCPRTFTQKYCLKTHQEAHMTEKNVQCDICGKAFVSAHRLRSHTWFLHRFRALLSCDYCGREFKDKRSLRRHLLELHMTHKDFLCSACPKAFGSITSLKVHLLSHEKVKKLACAICNMRFHTNYRLERHLRTHSSARPFTCDICSKSYKEKYNLQSHINTVHNKKPEARKSFPCRLCDGSFSRPGLLHKHLEKTHLVAPTEYSDSE